MNMIRFLVAASLSLFALVGRAEAETWTLNKAIDRYGDEASYNMKYWSNSSGNPGPDTTEIDPTGAYVVGKRFGMHATNRTFPCESLTVRSGGQLSFTGDGVLDCANLILGDGAQLHEYKSVSASTQDYGHPYLWPRLTGKMTVLSGSSNPVMCWSSYNCCGMAINSAVYGDENAVMKVGRDNGRKDSLWSFSDLSNFRGTIRVFSLPESMGLADYPTYGTNFSYGVQLVSTAMPGKIHVTGSNSTIFIPNVGCDSSVGTLELDADSWLRFNFDITEPTDLTKTRTGTLTVTDALTVKGRIVVTAVYDAKSLGTQTKGYECPILVGPVGTKIDATKFEFFPNPYFEPSPTCSYPQRVRLETRHDEATDRDTLYAVVIPTCIATSVKCPDTPGNVQPYSGLDLTEGASLSFKFDTTDEAMEKTRTGRIDVSDALSLSGPVTVTANYKPIMSTVGEEISNAILTAPAGVRLDPSQFVFVPNASYEPTGTAGQYPQRIHFEVKTGADGRDTLYAVVEPIVVRIEATAGGIAAEGSANYNTALANGSSLIDEKFSAGWSDKRMPHAKAHYWMRCAMNSPFGEDPYVFPGYSIVYNGASIYMYDSGTFDFPLWESGGNNIRCGLGGNPVLRGRMRANGQYGFGFQVFNSQTLTVEGEIEGRSDVTFSGNTGTSYHHSYFALKGLNTNLTGRIVMNRIVDPSDKRWPTPNMIETYQELHIFDGRNLGGAMAAPTYNALELQGYHVLYARNDLTLSADVNRGICVSQDGGRLFVTNGATMTCWWPITLNAPLYKEGPGTLALGGAIRFLDAGGQPTDELPAEAAKRTFVVTNGCVKALSCDCLNGLTVDLGPGTALALDLDADDADLRAYGIRNVKTDVPFGAGPVTIVADNLPELTREGGTFGVLTVKTSVADAIRDRMTVVRPKVSGLTRRLVRTDNPQDETTTFSVEYKESGMSILIR